MSGRGLSLSLLLLLCLGLPLVHIDNDVLRSGMICLDFSNSFAALLALRLFFWHRYSYNRIRMVFDKNEGLYWRTNPVSPCGTSNTNAPVNFPPLASSTEFSAPSIIAVAEKS